MHLEITYQQLIYLARWPIPIRDGKASLHPWEFTLSMACQCDLHNWIMTPVLDCPFIHSMKIAIILNLREIWNLLRELQNSCAWSCEHQFPGSFVDRYCGFHSTSLGTILKSISCTWLLTGLGGVNTRMYGFLATSSRINFHGHFNYSSFSFRILHHQNIP